MTNNPSKVEDLENAGFDVEELRHSSEPNEENKDYLKTKASKMNHNLDVKDQVLLVGLQLNISFLGFYYLAYQLPP